MNLSLYLGTLFSNNAILNFLFNLSKSYRFDLPVNSCPKTCKLSTVFLGRRLLSPEITVYLFENLIYYCFIRILVARKDFGILGFYKSLDCCNKFCVAESIGKVLGYVTVKCFRNFLFDCRSKRIPNGVSCDGSALGIFIRNIRNPTVKLCAYRGNLRCNIRIFLVLDIRGNPGINGCEDDAVHIIGDNFIYRRFACSRKSGRDESFNSLLNVNCYVVIHFCHNGRIESNRLTLQKLNVGIYVTRNLIIYYIVYIAVDFILENAGERCSYIIKVFDCRKILDIYNSNVNRINHKTCRIFNEGFDFIIVYQNIFKEIDIRVN